MSSINVTKFSGETEPYDETKLQESLQSAGATTAITDQITSAIQEILYDGISTQKIYSEAFEMLRTLSEKSAGRYKLKEAIFELGPSGYPFERFISELLKRMGYETQSGIFIQGHCISHEIDVFAHKDQEVIIAECKFHNREDGRSDIRVPLYIHSRFLDIKKRWETLPEHKGMKHSGWIVTNTRFTKDAEIYGECVGLKLLGWRYPRHEGLNDLVTKANLHPVTSLSTLDSSDKNALLKNDILFCKQICENRDVLYDAGIHPRRANRIAREAGAICDLEL